MGSGLVSLILWARDSGCDVVVKARAKIEGNWVKHGEAENREVLLCLHLPLYFSKKAHVVEYAMSGISKKRG